jgi:hypothetical protein
MSDFLRNLIARSRGDLPTIRPRLPSLYEPYRHGTIFSSLSNGANEFNESASGVGLMPAPSGLHRNRPGLSAAESPEGNRDALQASPLAGSLLPRLGAWRISNASAPDRADASSKNKWNSLEPSPTASFVARASSDGTFETEAHENRHTETHVPAEPPDRRPRRGQNFITAKRSDSSLDPAPRLHSGNLKSETPIHVMTVRHQPDAGALRLARGEVAGSQNRAHRSTPRESPINITIGRVEVRAIMATPPARRAAPTKSRATLSLDEYLKQRDRGLR